MGVTRGCASLHAGRCVTAQGQRTGGCLQGVLGVHTLMCMRVTGCVFPAPLTVFQPRGGDGAPALDVHRCSSCQGAGAPQCPVVSPGVQPLAW